MIRRYSTLLEHKDGFNQPRKPTSTLEVSDIRFHRSQIYRLLRRTHTAKDGGNSFCLTAPDVRIEAPEFAVNLHWISDRCAGTVAFTVRSLR